MSFPSALFILSNSYISSRLTSTLIAVNFNYFLLKRCVQRFVHQSTVRNFFANSNRNFKQIIMKTLHQNTIKCFSENTIYKTNDEANRVEIVDFISNIKNNRYHLILHSSLFTHEPVQIKTNENKLILIIDELKHTPRNKQMPQNNWERFYYHSYARLHNISFLLPGDNFFLVQSILVPENFLLKIILAQLHMQ